MDKVILLKPYFSHTLWGGTKLRDEFGYDEPGDDIGECWGISAHPSGEALADSGEFKGLKVSELWNDHRELFGNAKGDRFPLLIKIIDANKDLSIQVHPDDAYAAEHENGSLGKNECWYVLDCPKDGELIVGHNASSKEELCDMIDNGKWNDLIRRVPVKPGDTIRIDAGTVHAITAGVCVLETQQSSDITYRLYDYDRLQNGKLRPLHLDKSKDVIDVPAAPVNEQVIRGEAAKDNTVTELVKTDYFTVSKVRVNGECSFETDADFICASVIKGSGKVFGTEVKTGSHMLITAEGAKNVVISGDMEIILSRV